jgi:hypothetical protein
MPTSPGRGSIHLNSLRTSAQTALSVERLRSSTMNGYAAIH